MKKKCDKCGVLTKNKKYCSLDCRNKGYLGVRKTEDIIISCKICEKEFKAKQRQVDNGKKYCSVECQHQGYRVLKNKRITSICLFCKTEFEDIKRTGNKKQMKYCSRDCKDMHQSELYKGDGNPVYGKEHSEEWKEMQSDRVTKMWESDEHRQKVKEGQEKFEEENGYWCGRSEDSNLKRIETYLEKYGVDHNWKNEEVRKKCEETNLKLYGKTSFELMIEAFKRTGGTSIEKKINEILKINNIEFKKSFYIYFDGKKHKIYDFYLPKHNLLIEADGIYWHGHPEFFKILNETQLTNIENDKFKNELAKEKGYNLVRFWGNEIRENNFENTLLQEIKRWEKKLE